MISIGRLAIIIVTVWFMSGNCFAESNSKINMPTFDDNQVNESSSFGGDIGMPPPQLEQITAEKLNNIVELQKRSEERFKQLGIFINKSTEYNALVAEITQDFREYLETCSRYEGGCIKFKNMYKQNSDSEFSGIYQEQINLCNDIMSVLKTNMVNYGKEIDYISLLATQANTAAQDAVRFRQNTELGKLALEKDKQLEDRLKGLATYTDGLQKLKNKLSNKK